jgi:membrane protease YdiL (CAAX protease family)
MTTDPQQPESAPEPSPPPLPIEPTFVNLPAIEPPPFVPLPPPLTELTPTSPPKPWGFWATLGWSVLILAVFYLIVFAVIAVPALARMISQSDANKEEAISQATVQFLCQASIAATIVAVPLIFLFARMRRMGVLDYLGLRRPGWLKGGLSYLALPVVYYSMAFIYSLAKVNIGEKEQTLLLQAVPSRFLLFLTLVVCAPLFEELLFRGFLFRGIEARFGPLAAVIVTSIFFASLHFQYNFWGVLLILCLGLIFGFTRWVTRSVVITMLQHATVNLLAFLGIVYHFG